MTTTIDAKKLYAREPLTRIITKDIRPESFVYEVETDRMHNNTVDAILIGDLITVSKTCLNEIKPGKQYVITDTSGNIILGCIDLDAPNQTVYIKPLNSSYSTKMIKFDQMATIEVIYLLDRMLTAPVKTQYSDTVIFEPKQDEVTQNEYESLIGLTLFANSKNPYGYGDVHKIYCGHPGTMICRMNDFLSGIDRFLTGRFKYDRGLLHLKDLFKDAIAAAPHMTEKYFYAYSELMQLMVTIYNSEGLIDHFSGVFENLANKVEYFDVAETGNLNQSIV